MCEPVFANTLQVIKNIPQERSIRYKGLLDSHQKKIPAHTIAVTNEDCIDACVRLVTEYPGAKVGLLNMASDRCPGGGVVRGAHAQEEDICRRTTLYPTLKQQRYPLAHDELIFTPNVKVVKNSNYSLLPNPINIGGVVSAAAIRRPNLDTTGKYTPADYTLMKNKVRMVLETFEYHNCTHIVLGAWGCGAFNNPPKQVAGICIDVLKDFNFEHVLFAILTPWPKDYENLACFRRALTNTPTRATKN